MYVSYSVISTCLNQRQEHGNAIYIQDWSLSTDMKFIMVKTDFKKVRNATKVKDSPISCLAMALVGFQQLLRS